MRHVIFQFKENADDGERKRVLDWLASTANSNIRSLFEELDDPELARILIADIDDGLRDEVLDRLNADSAVVYAEEDPERKLIERPAKRLTAATRDNVCRRNRPGPL